MEVGAIADADRPPGGGCPSPAAACRRLAAAWGRERGLFHIGLLALALGLAGAVVLAVHGRRLAPEGDLGKTIAFDVALAVFALTLPPIIPLAGFSDRARRRWTASQTLAAFVSLAITNVQTYRGVDPRFPQSGATVDRLASVLFGVAAVGSAVSFVVFAVRLFRRRGNSGGGALLLGARYGAVSALVGYGAGFWMIVNGGARFGMGADILPLHALGFHGLQAAPVAALLFHWGHASWMAARRWTHVAGAAWLGACGALAWQTLLGSSVLDPSPAALTALALLVVWGLAAARAAYALRPTKT